MKIFFNASLTGKNGYLKNFETICEALEKVNSSSVDAPVMESNKEKVAKETEKEAETYYKQLIKRIKDADICVFEVSYPSTGIGHEVSLSLQYGKPVIVFYLKNHRPFILEGLEGEKLQLIEYDMDDIFEKVGDAVDYATGMQDTRFNFFISPKHQHFLDWVSKNRKVPRAVFLRRLIEQEMEEDEEYHAA